MDLVVFSGAGISAESGLKTFRDSDGLWEQYNITDVATPEAWEKDRELVLEFYNERRVQVIKAEPNDAHHTLKELEDHFDVHIITQNIDDLHERAGSSKVLHLHGEIIKARSSVDSSLLYDIENGSIELGDKCEKGSQLRPHVVWFGEAVPEMENAASIVANADLLMVIGSSLNVYPAAGLVQLVDQGTPIFIVDPKDVPVQNDEAIHIKEKAGVGVPILADELIERYILKRR